MQRNRACCRPQARADWRARRPTGSSTVHTVRKLVEHNNDSAAIVAMARERFGQRNDRAQEDQCESFQHQAWLEHRDHTWCSIYRKVYHARVQYEKHVPEQSRILQMTLVLYYDALINLADCPASRTMAPDKA